jgi:hypothetical protein
MPFTPAKEPVALPQLNIVTEYDSKLTVATKRQMRPANQTKDRPGEGGSWIVCRALVLKLRHGLQFILGGVIHRVIGIPTRTGAGCGGRRGGSCSTGSGSRGAVWSGSSCRAFAGGDVEAVVEVTGWSTHFSLSKATAT